MGLLTRFSNIRGAGGERICGRVNSREITEGIATSLERERLRLPGDAAVFRIYRVREHAGRDFLVEHITVSAALFAGLLDERAMVDDIVSLARHYGILLGRGEERISTVVPSARHSAGTWCHARHARDNARSRPVHARSGPSGGVAHCLLEFGRHLLRQRDCLNRPAHVRQLGEALIDTELSVVAGAAGSLDPLLPSGSIDPRRHALLDALNEPRKRILSAVEDMSC